MSHGIFSEEEKIWQKRQGNKDQRKSASIKKDYEIWRKEWKRRGPLEFATYVLMIDPETGKPIALSLDQQEFLTDVCINGVQLAIIAAGRGSGKSFVLAVYIAWRIFTHDFYQISCLGGSGEQSKKVYSYVSGWIRNNPQLREFTFKNIQLPPTIKTYASSGCIFTAVSATSTRGPHVKDVIIDEEAAGEASGKTEHIKAALWQGSTSEDLRIIKSSTPHLAHGDFLETWNEYQKLGYKRYNWSIAKHISGKKDPYKIYMDTNVHHWFSNIPWSTDQTIQMLRNQKSNDEWLCEGLGAFSISSGLVFKVEDLKACTCDKCPECHPYEEANNTFNGCPLIQYYLQLNGMKTTDIPSSPRRAKQYVGERIEGIDWGQGTAPDAYTATGKLGGTVFVLDQKELFGQSDGEKIDTATDIANGLGIEIIRPDPAQSAYNNTLMDKGYTIHELFSFEGGQEKDTYVATLKRYIERHNLQIPKAYSSLLRSLRNLTYDKNGKIRKVDDHSFDSLIYAVSFYGEEEDAPVLSSKEGGAGSNLWKPDRVPEPLVGDHDKEADEPMNDNFNPFDEDYLKRKKGQSDYVQGANSWY
jgi:hypothetical protein